MHSYVTSKNVKWCHLIWPTLYMPFSIGYFGGPLEPSLYISNGFLEDYAMANRECDAMVDR